MHIVEKGSLVLEAQKTLYPLSEGQFCLSDLEKYISKNIQAGFGRLVK